MTTKNPKRPRDTNQLAKSIVNLAIGEAKEVDPNEGKDPNAVALGRKGGLKGGKARAKKLTAEERSAIAKKAANARWDKTKQREDQASSAFEGKSKHIISTDH